MFIFVHLHARGYLLRGGVRSCLLEVGLGSQSSLPSMPMRAKASDRGGLLSGADPLESVESPRLHLCPVGVPLAPPPPPAPSMLPGMFGGFALALPEWIKIRDFVFGLNLHV